METQAVSNGDQHSRVQTSFQSIDKQVNDEKVLSHEELMAALKKQVGAVVLSPHGQIEYYFSQENLAKDSYLLSLMNDSGYVSLTTIAGFRKVRDLSTSMDDILEALKGAEGVVVDAANLLIKPAFVFERKTIILRDVPEGTTEEEIRSLFEGLATVESLKAEFGNTWYDRGWSMIQVCGCGLGEDCYLSSGSVASATVAWSQCEGACEERVIYEELDEDVDHHP